MAVPKKKTSKQRKRKRRTHLKAQTPTLATCETTGDPKLRHRVCPTSGMYRGRKVFDVDSE